MSEKLNFGNGENDPLNGFDAAPGPDSFDLSGFDAATGATTVPPGKYVLRIEEGKLKPTNAGKQAYRLRFAVVEPAAQAGFTRVVGPTCSTAGRSTRCLGRVAGTARG